MNAQSIRRDAGRQRGLPAILLCLALTACGGPAKPVGVVGHVEGFGGMVAADEPRAVLVGRDVMSAGGSPADAAVAMAFTMAATLPSQVGLGAGGACIIYDREKQTTEVLDFAPPTPGVPALPRGMYALFAKYGKLRWEQLVSPAEEMARLGVPVSRALAQEMTPAATGPIFVKGDGQPLKEGDTLVEDDLGATLSRFRSRGVGDFYTGAWANDVVADMRAAGIAVTADDMRNFVPRWQAPVAVPYGNDVAYFAPAAGGPLEARLWASLAGDGLYAKWGQQAKPQELAKALGVAVQNNGQPGPTEGTGLVAIDGQGSAVTCSLSLNRPFGGGRMVPGTGILPAAAAGDGRIPFDVGPMLAVNTNSNEFRFAAAGGGGPIASTAVVQTGLAALVDAAPLGDAVAGKRLFAGLQEPLPGRVNAIRCTSGDPRPSRCQVATDPRGFGMAVTVGAN